MASSTSFLPSLLRLSPWELWSTCGSTCFVEDLLADKNRMLVEDLCKILGDIQLKRPKQDRQCFLKCKEIPSLTPQGCQPLEVTPCPCMQCLQYLSALRFWGRYQKLYLYCSRRRLLNDLPLSHPHRTHNSATLMHCLIALVYFNVALNSSTAQ